MILIVATTFSLSDGKKSPSEANQLPREKKDKSEEVSKRKSPNGTARGKPLQKKRKGRLEEMQKQDPNIYPLF